MIVCLKSSKSKWNSSYSISSAKIWNKFWRCSLYKSSCDLNSLIVFEAALSTSFNIIIVFDLSNASITLLVSGVGIKNWTGSKFSSIELIPPSLKWMNYSSSSSRYRHTISPALLIIPLFRAIWSLHKLMYFATSFSLYGALRSCKKSSLS
jgi:hypothetical protein